MPALRRVALVTDDLMFRSQLGAALRSTGAELAVVDIAGAPAAAEGADAVFVDLNRDTAHRLGLIATLRQRDEAQRIVAFCHHGADETRTMAMRVGASSCVTNGGLQAVALRLAGVPLPSGSRR